MVSSTDKFNQWIAEQYAYDESGNIDDRVTIDNFLQVCGETGNVEIKTLALITGITRSQFYQVKDNVDRVFCMF